MALENLYQCTPSQLQTLPEKLADAFYNSPLFQIAFPNEKQRKECMVFYFKQYLYTIAPEALFLADSEEMNTIMIVCDSRRFNQKEYYKRLCKMNLRFVRFVRKLGLKHCLYLIKHWDMFSSRWMKDFERSEHFHLDMMITDAGQRHQGNAERMVRELIDEGDIMNMDVSAEVYQKKTALWLEKLGFVLMNTIVDEENDLYQYCLINQQHKE